MTIQEIKARLANANLAAVARYSGIDYFVLWRIVNSKTAKPAHEDIVKLDAYLNSEPKTLLEKLRSNWPEYYSLPPGASDERREFMKEVQELKKQAADEIERLMHELDWAQGNLIDK